jgi:hypothetical protein
MASKPVKPKKVGCGSGNNQAGNKNALRNGNKVHLNNRLVVGELPVTMVAVKREGCKYRRNLEAAVLKAKGTINLTDSHLIDTASAATVASGICRWLLRNRLKQMSVNDIRSCSGDIVRNKERRDAAVKALELDALPEPVDLKSYVLEIEGNQK